jgi:hypothetical protein
VAAEADRQQRQLRVLGQVVADHGEVGGVPDVVVDDARTRGMVGKGGLCAAGRAKVLGIH